MQQLKNSLPANLKMLGQEACANWRSFAEGLLNATPQTSEDITWFYVTKYQDQKHFFASNGHNEIRPQDECQTANMSQWLVLTLLDSGWNANTTVHPIVLDKFGGIIETLKQIPGLTSATIHFLGKGVDITTHNDGTDDRCHTTLVTIFSPVEDLTLIVDGIDNVPNQSDTFSFNSFLPHSIRNTGSDDWVYYVLRISKDQYVFN